MFRVDAFRGDAFRVGALRIGTLRPGTFRLRAIGRRALGLRALGTGLLLGTGLFRFTDAARGAVDDHEGVVLRLPHPFAVLAPAALGLVLVAALDDGGVGGDRAGVGVGGEGHADAHGDGFSGGNGEPEEPAAGAVGARACASAGAGRRPRLAFLPALRLLALVAPVALLAAEDADLLVAVGALPGDPVFDPGAAWLGELQLDLVRGQPAVAVGEDEDRVQGPARRVGGVGEVEEPGAVATAGCVPVRGALDPGLDGEVLGVRVTADGLPVGG